MAGNAALDEPRIRFKPWVRRQKAGEWTEWLIIATIATMALWAILYKLTR